MCRAVDLAWRLNDLTTEAKQRLGRVLASEEAISRAPQEAGRWTVADEILLRGFGEPILAYEPTNDSVPDSVRQRESRPAERLD